ncbi:hypothetical protein F4810DRAFT_707310 [Camillea tinctor]|nr:hypothetical protein F4810DRAFT_707310 [Camillea tinctor]
MCRTAHFRSRNCGHHWLQISQPCGPGRGFATCATFGDGVAREPTAECRVGSLCPACSASSSSYFAMPAPALGYGGGNWGWGAPYDLNSVRMVTDVRHRWRWGVGPSRRDPGVDVDCVVM